jgi:hypothetical protein
MVPFSTYAHKQSLWECPYTYKQTIGALLYLSNNTRPDLAFAVNYLAGSQSNPTDHEWILLKRIFQYLKGTIGFGLIYTHNTNPTQVYVDADFAGDKTTRKSTTAYLIYQNGNLLHWRSSLQSCTAESSGEAEFMAVCEAAHDILYYSRLWEETIGPVQYPITLLEDNNAAISQCTKLSSKSRLKHLAVKYLKVKEYFQTGLLRIEKVDTQNQLADCLTKPLSEKVFLLMQKQLLSR